MKNILIISLFFPLFNCGVKKDLATAQQENIELEKRLTELEKKQDELKKQNQELINQNQEYKDQMSILIRKKEKNNQAVVEDRPPLPIIKKKFPVTEDPASFPGGEEKFFKFIEDNLKYPSQAKGVSGTVYVKFIVEKDGSLTDIKVARGLGYGCDEEALRIVKLMPKWFPAKQSEKPVRIRMVVPIKFKQK